ncbi:MAG: hypothetical protein M0T75_09675 [Chloroflexi bacterium]|nr:hypothetical protein [Chloroflexota bacterium]
MDRSTPGALLFGLQLVLRVAAGPVLLGGALVVVAAALLEALARS